LPPIEQDFFVLMGAEDVYSHFSGFSSICLLVTRIGQSVHSQKNRLKHKKNGLCRALIIPKTSIKSKLWTTAGQKQDNAHLTDVGCEITFNNVQP